jgi:hypothetical protein
MAPRLAHPLNTVERPALRRSALLADFILNEKLNVFGWVGCALCINGSITIVLHAPAERQLQSVLEVWDMAMQPGGQRYVCCVFPPQSLC